MIYLCDSPLIFSCKSLTLNLLAIPKAVNSSSGFNHTGSCNNSTVLLLHTVRNPSHTVPLSNRWCPSLMGAGEEGPVGKETAASFLSQGKPGRWQMGRAEKQPKAALAPCWQGFFTEAQLGILKHINDWETYLPGCSDEVQQGFPHFLHLRNFQVCSGTKNLVLAYVEWAKTARHCPIFLQDYTQENALSGLKNVFLKLSCSSIWTNY